jgi:hypothetical protein
VAAAPAPEEGRAEPFPKPASLVLSSADWGLGIRSMFGRAMLVVGLVTLGLGIAAAIAGSEGK